MENTADISTQTLDFVQTANEALGTAYRLAKKASDDKKAALEKVSRVAKELEQVGFIESRDAKLASDQLSSHDQVLDILSNVLSEVRDIRAKSASVSLGEGVTADSTDREVSGSSHHKNASYVGYHRGEGEHSEADRALLRLIDRDV